MGRLPRLWPGLHSAMRGAITPGAMRKIPDRTQRLALLSRSLPMTWWGWLRATGYTGKAESSRAQKQ
jgi:hypothetical protein